MARLADRVERLERELAEAQALLAAILQDGVEAGDAAGVRRLLELARSHRLHASDTCMSCGHQRRDHIGRLGRCSTPDCACRELIAAAVR